MSSTENNTQGARRDEQRTRFLSRENIVKMIKTTVVLSALFLSIWAVVLNQAIDAVRTGLARYVRWMQLFHGREWFTTCETDGRSGLG